MKNLAGKSACEVDMQITEELREAGIEWFECQRHSGEVAYGGVGEIDGPLGRIRFERRRYYWSAKGRVPMDLAEELYETNPDEIRVAGHCAAPPPHEWAETVSSSDGKAVVSREEYDRAVERAKGNTIWRDVVEKLVPEDKAKETISFISVYHIDTQRGLNEYAAAIRRYMKARGKR